MKQTPELDRAQRNMQPGEMTLHGFLGEDRRSLADILQADNETVHARGLIHRDIAIRLRALMEAGRDLMERECLVEGRFRVTVRDDRGLIPCPFSDGLFEKGDCHLVDPETRTEITWNELSIHLILVHGFYSGQGSLYRLNPASLIDLLLIQPGATEPSACTPAGCRGEAMSEAEVIEAAKRLNPRWTVTSSHHLIASYSLANFAESLNFTCEIGRLAEEARHHPEIHLSWGRVKVELFTHRSGGLSTADFALAVKIDDRYSAVFDQTK